MMGIWVESLIFNLCLFAKNRKSFLLQSADFRKALGKQSLLSSSSIERFYLVRSSRNSEIGSAPEIRRWSRARVHAT